MKTFQPRGSYTKSQGVTAKMLKTFPTQTYHPGCMPAENAQYYPPFPTASL
jgi:NADH:ubiquinone oxidoreductase subunit B-like Fe-S oxidoreductase